MGGVGGGGGGLCVWVCVCHVHAYSCSNVCSSKLCVCLQRSVLCIMGKSARAQKEQNAKPSKARSFANKEAKGLHEDRKAMLGYLKFTPKSAKADQKPKNFARKACKSTTPCLQTRRVLSSIVGRQRKTARIWVGLRISRRR